MKLFPERKIFQAMQYAQAGGQALHLQETIAAFKKNAPKCFKSKRIWGHLLDDDRTRLEATARRLGVRVVKVERPGARGQHVNLCGVQLLTAIRECKASNE